ncbi:MAG: DUF1329 domain-containing protein [Deltaproteobacteria bacterium]|nr:DUF1329 domain-containing protein [Deltaproteobacteria bacterium]
MRHFFKTATCMIGLAVVMMTMPLTLFAGALPHPDSYLPSFEEALAQKEVLDDPRPIKKNFGPQQVCPKEILQRLTFDEAKMKSAWRELVGFATPDVVGKISPEIKPGKYMYKDVEQNPALRELISDAHLNRIRKAGPPHMGAFEEFEIVPPRQYYWSLPLTEMSKRNMGKAKLDDQGYMIEETWGSGIPFPRPEGKFKGSQLIYNFLTRYTDYGLNASIYDKSLGWNKNLKIDGTTHTNVQLQRLSGRIFFEPYGFLSKRSEKRNEIIGLLMIYEAPRDIAGSVFNSISFKGNDAYSQQSMYLPSMRRIRKLSATDTQDAVSGQSICYDDLDIFGKKLTPNIYPVSVKILAEREYLFPAATLDGGEWIDSKNGYAIRNQKFERRPIAVVEVTELDKNYVYSKRILYADLERLILIHGDYFDQKGRKYRSQSYEWAWHPEFGMTSGLGMWLYACDYIDGHSEISFSYSIPAPWPAKHVSLRGLLRRAK